MINWEVILWTCVTIAVLMGVIGLVLTIVSSVNMRKRRKQVAETYTTLAVGCKVIFGGGILGKVVRMGEDEFIGVEIAPKTIVEISRFAVQQIVTDQKPAEKKDNEKK